jgi:hypothetical protein
MPQPNSISVPSKGLVFDCLVSEVIDATHFRAAGLVGFGDAFFQGWSAYVIRKADGTGTPPQGEAPVCSNYVSATGDFTHPAYTAPLTVGDEIYLIHPGYNAIIATIGALPGFDGVCFDDLLGVAGTVLPIGTPGIPSNNLADVLTMLTARNLQKIYLVGTGAGHAITFNVDVDLELVGNPEYDITIDPGVTAVFNGDVCCQNLVNAAGVLTINGKCLVVMNTQNSGDITIFDEFSTGILTNSGNFTVTAPCRIDVDLLNTGAGIVTINSNCFVTGVTNNTGVGSIQISGALSTGTLSNADLGFFNIVGDCDVGITLTNSGAGAITVFGNLTVKNNLDNLAGSVTSVGVCKVSGSVSTTAGPIGFGKELKVGGDISSTGGPITIRGGCFLGGSLIIDNVFTIITGDSFIGDSIEQTGGGNFNIHGNLTIGGHLINTDSEVTIQGDLAIAGDITLPAQGYLNNIGTGIIQIDGNAYFSLDLSNTGVGTVEIIGNLQVRNIVNSNAGGTVNISGIGRIYGLITNAGTLTYHDDFQETASQEAVGATAVNGVTWKDLLDKSANLRHVKICGFMVTVAGGWAGLAKLRITDGAGNKIFPFQAEYVEGTDFTSAILSILNFPLMVRDYKIQFRSSNAGDGAGKTLALTNLDIIALK